MPEAPPRGAPASGLFVPGRVCLFGEHSDWAASYRGHAEASPGYCLVTGTEQGLRASAEPLAGAFEIEACLEGGRREGPVRLPFAEDALERAARSGAFVSYAAGVALELRARHRVGGLRLRVASDLPVARGLSSSAAACVLVARAFGRVYGLGLGPREEMELAYRGERRAGSECGRMDQICAFGTRPVWLRFEGDALEVRPVDAGAPLHLLVVDLRRSKDTRRILAELNACFPDAPGERTAAVRRALGRENAELVGRARRALEAGDARELGALMREAQARFDARVAPVCPELEAPRLHAVLRHPAAGELAWGGKGVGSQGDGCAQLVARGPAERERLAACLEAELGVRALPLTIAPARTPTARQRALPGEADEPAGQGGRPEGRPPRSEAKPSEVDG